MLLVPILIPYSIVAYKLFLVSLVGSISFLYLVKVQRLRCFSVNIDNIWCITHTLLQVFNNWIKFCINAILHILHAVNIVFIAITQNIHIFSSDNSRICHYHYRPLFLGRHSKVQAVSFNSLECSIYLITLFSKIQGNCFSSLVYTILAHGLTDFRLNLFAICFNLCSALRGKILHILSGKYFNGLLSGSVDFILQPLLFLWA